jgi:hypothetical protein
VRPTLTNALATPAPRATRWFAAAGALAVVWSPRIGWACSVCTAGRDEANRVAFIATTAFLTILPLLMIGGVAWWLCVRVRRHGDSTASAVRPQPAPAAARTTQA